MAAVRSQLCVSFMKQNVSQTHKRAEMYPARRVYRRKLARPLGGFGRNR